MTVDSNTSSGRGNDPEQIDLIELLLQLWRGKMTIIVAVIIAILLAVGYLMIAKEKWTSTAIITQPDAAQVATYTNALNVLYGGNAPKISEVQANFISRFSSAFSALSEALDNQKEREKLTIEQSVKGQALPLSVSYVSTTAEGAQRRLAEYIQQVDEEVAKELEVDLKDNITLQTKTLQESLETQEVVAQEQKICVLSKSKKRCAMRMRPKSRSRRFSKPRMLPGHDVPAGERCAKIDDTERSDASTGLFSGLLPDEADTAGH